MCCHTDTETDPIHCMPTVLSSASVRCHATSYPVKGQRKGKRGRELWEKKDVKKEKKVSNPKLK